MSFWDIVWFIFITWVFVAYLMVMFSIISDIFRDRELSGVWKAVWVVALVFLPFITAVVYLISRGGSMAERSMRAAGLHQQQQDTYIRGRRRPRLAGRPDHPGPGAARLRSPSRSRSTRR